uniref:HAT C-terminal dimerisation domain-containing protein n=1 Tax=Lactuca sativa TaxID=4236 RepID=A0A9R1V013_LACSA|nr:hypothetical protein LSAT_V11C700369810 [Lactuca sativa]
MAMDVLAIPISTVASEATFSVGGRVIDPYRSSLVPDTVEKLICGGDWIRNRYGIKKKIEESNVPRLTDYGVCSAIFLSSSFENRVPETKTENPHTGPCPLHRTEVRTNWGLAPYIGPKSEADWDLVPYIGPKSEADWDLVPYIGPKSEADIGPKSEADWDLVPYIGPKSEAGWDLVPYIGPKSEAG